MSCFGGSACGGGLARGGFGGAIDGALDFGGNAGCLLLKFFGGGIGFRLGSGCIDTLAGQAASVAAGGPSGVSIGRFGVGGQWWCGSLEG